MEYPPLEVKVWGEYACFTRPELKVERVSYSVMTPSAARGILEAIFWKPEFTWKVREIHVLRDIQHFSMVRNEVSRRMGIRTAGIDITDTDCRTQRHTLGLRDVAYLIKADIQLKSRVTDDPAKYRDQFRRRVTRGQCYHRPYLGCREFAAYFGQPAGDERPIEISDELGRMLLDIEYAASGQLIPHFYLAGLQNGVLHVPPFDFSIPGGEA